MSQTLRHSILVVEDSKVIAEVIRQALAQVGYNVHVTDTAEDGAAAVFHHPPDLLVTDVTLPGMDGYELCRQLRKKPATRTLPILMLTSHGDIADKIAGFEAGANDYLTKPFQVEELIYRIKSLLIRFAAPDPVDNGPKGRTIVLFGGKGGVGKTTVAVNLSIALQRRSKQPVILVDTDFSFGDVGVHLNLPSVRSISDLLPYLDNNQAIEVLPQVVTHHPSGLHALLNPPNPESSELITPAHISRLLDMLTERYAYVVIDSPPSCYDERMLMALEYANDIMLIVTPEIGPVKNTNHFLQLAIKLGLNLDKIHIVLNRADSEVGINSKEIERTLKRRIEFALNSGGRVAVASVNQGVPLIMAQPKLPLAQQLWQLAGTLIAESSIPA